MRIRYSNIHATLQVDGHSLAIAPGTRVDLDQPLGRDTTVGEQLGHHADGFAEELLAEEPVLAEDVDVEEPWDDSATN